jgi:hypothetical protein
LKYWVFGIFSAKLSALLKVRYSEKATKFEKNIPLKI